MKNKIMTEVSPDKLIRYIGWILGIVALLITVECSSSKGPGISVYCSSQDGDRLTKKADVQFTPDIGSSLPVITVDEGTRFQKIDGFGASFNEAGMICLNSLGTEAQGKVLKMVFDPDSGAGFNIMKAPIAACDFASAGPWYSFNETAGDTAMIHFSIARDSGANGMITYIKKASKFGRFEIETTMDFAPDWMYISLKKGERHIKPVYYAALARYYSKYIQAYAATGITLNYLNPFNEPENSWYSNVTYKAIGEMIKNYIIPRFRADGITTKIQLCESVDRPEALKKFPAALDDPEVRKYISTLTVHGYDWDKFSTLTELHNRYPDIPIWLTEVCYARVGDQPNNEPPGGPDHMPVYEFSDGEFWGNMIMNDMKNRVSAWVYWNMILDEDGGPWLVSTEHGDPDYNRQQPVVIVNRKNGEVTFTGLYYYLTHFSRFVKPGAFRIDCKGGSEQLNFAGFRNADSRIILNIINNGNETDCKILWNNKMVIQKLKAHSITTLIWSSEVSKPG
jgi:glucosylceramidase